MYNSKRYQKPINSEYSVVVTLQNGEQLDEQIFTGGGKREFLIEEPQEVKFCFSVSQKQQNYKELLKQIKRHGKKVDLRLAHIQELELEKEELQVDQRVITSVRLLNKSKAVKSLQTGRENVRNKIEKRLYKMSRHYIAVTMLEIIVYLVVNFVSLHIIKTYIRRQKL